MADVVESGRTLREAGLVADEEPIVRSEAVLVARDTDQVANEPMIQRLCARLEGVVLASQYKLVDYDVPERLLDEASLLTPGIESPTVSPLAKQGWVAVRAMVPTRDVHAITDQLADLGARAIFLTDLRSYRP